MAHRTALQPLSKIGRHFHRNVGTCTITIPGLR
jgi:hypothetical protein